MSPPEPPAAGRKNRGPVEEVRMLVALAPIPGGYVPDITGLRGPSGGRKPLSPESAGARLARQYFLDRRSGPRWDIEVPVRLQRKLM